VLYCELYGSRAKLHGVVFVCSGLISHYTKASENLCGVVYYCF